MGEIYKVFTGRFTGPIGGTVWRPFNPPEGEVWLLQSLTVNPYVGTGAAPAWFCVPPYIESIRGATNLVSVGGLYFDWSEDSILPAGSMRTVIESRVQPIVSTVAEEGEPSHEWNLRVSGGDENSILDVCVTFVKSPLPSSSYKVGRGTTNSSSASTQNYVFTPNSGETWALQAFGIFNSRSEIVTGSWRLKAGDRLISANPETRFTNISVFFSGTRVTTSGIVTITDKIAAGVQPVLFDNSNPFRLEFIDLGSGSDISYYYALVKVEG